MARHQSKLSPEQQEHARGFLQGMLETLGYQTRVEATVREDQLWLEVNGVDARDLAHRANGNPDHKTIEALRDLVRASISDREGRGVPVVINVSDYLEMREQAMRGVAKRLATLSKQGRPVAVFGMSAVDRRFIHREAGEVEGTKTRSDGYGVFRHLVIES